MKKIKKKMQGQKKATDSRSGSGYVSLFSCFCECVSVKKMHECKKNARKQKATDSGSGLGLGLSLCMCLWCVGVGTSYMRHVYMHAHKCIP